MSKVRGIRGATTVNTNTRPEVIQATQEMLSSIVDKNKTLKVIESLIK